MLTIFDCDGVLVDSEIIAARVDAEVFKEIGFEIEPEEIIHRFAGLTSKDLMEVVESEIGRPVPEDLHERQHKLLNERLANEVEAVPGALELLDVLEGPRCVCSNSTTDRLQVMMSRTGLWDRFAPHIWSAPEVGDRKPKPDPNVYLYGMAQFNADPRETVVIEDSVFGVTSAHAAGARVIGFTGGAHAWPGLGELLTEAGAETVVSRHQDIPKVIEAFAEWSGIPT